jgi:hypothetical protein
VKQAAGRASSTCSCLDLLLDHEDGGSAFLLNVDKHLAEFAGVTSQKIVLFTITAERTSNLTQFYSFRATENCSVDNYECISKFSLQLIVTDNYVQIY